MPYADPIRRRTYHREYMRANPQTLTRAQRDKVNARMRRVYDPKRHREEHLKNRYGITQAEYDRLLASQKGGCALCGAPFATKTKMPLHVDHCRETGRIRGLLCTRHNQALGLLGDTVTSLERALRYLKGE